MMQSSLIGERPDRSIRIETTGRVLRPAMALPAALVDECAVEVSPEGLHIEARDHANVALIDLEVRASAFDAFEVDGEHTVGLNLDAFTDAIRDARLGKATADPVTIDVEGKDCYVEITREYDRVSVTRTDRLGTIDPDSIREPETPPDIPLDYRATVDTAAFTNVVEHLDGVDDAVTVAEADGQLVLTSTYGDSAAEFGDVATPLREDPVDGPVSIFSLDYISDIAESLSTGRVDAVTLSWGDELPCRIAFERTDADDEVLYSGELGVAPRISDGDAA